MKYINLIIPVLGLLMFSACSGTDDKGNTSAEKEIINIPATNPNDPEIFKLGSVDAQKMLDKCRNMAEIEKELLNVKARIHLIETRFDSKTAEDYIKGFKAYIRENNDSLAAMIFEE